MADEKTRSPVIVTRLSVRDRLLLVSLFFSLTTISIAIFLKVSTPNYPQRIQNVTQLANQRGAQLQANHIKPVGPSPALVASGKATPPPIAIAPTSPAPTYTKTTTEPIPIPTPSLTATQERHIVHLVLAQIKVPTPSTADLSNAVVSVLRKHPELTLPEITTSVTNYMKMNPPPSGPSGASGSPGTAGLNGLNGLNGMPGIGIASISATEDSTTNPPTVTFHFTMTDNTTADVGPLNLPAGPPGKDAPTIVSHNVVNNGDGTCKDTLELSDGSTADGNTYNCSPPPTTTESPTESIVPMIPT